MSSQTEDEKVRMSDLPYASAIGSIMYTIICTRPDISFAVNVTSKNQLNYRNDHWMAVKHILKYLKETKDKFLKYREGDLQVRGYTNSDF